MNALTADDLRDLSRWLEVVTPRAIFHVHHGERIAVTLEEVLRMDDSTRRIIIRHNDYQRREVH